MCLILIFNFSLNIYIEKSQCKHIKNFFHKQLEFGIKYETLAQAHVISYIKSKHGKQYKLNSVRKDGAFDFDLIHEASKSIISFEVKTDRSSRRTNNFFIEYNNGFGRPSGIEITKANYHIITDEINFYLIGTEELKDIVFNGNWRQVTNYEKFLKYDKSCGITQITRHGYIIPKDLIIKQAKIIN